MNNQTVLQKIFQFPLTKIIVGVALVIGLVFLNESASRPLFDKIQMQANLENLIISMIDSGLALSAYVLLFTFYEKRQITELSLSRFPKNATIGFLTGLILQSLFILVIYFLGNYSILKVNPVSFLLPGLATALSAGFVAEILIIGIVFRILEEKLGTIITLFITAIVFGIMHAGVPGATMTSILSVAINAGILLPAGFIFTRTLWFPIFLHFAWDFAEPGIYGGVNPSTSIDQSLFTSKISGPDLITGAQLGPQSSIQSVLFCLVLAIFLLRSAKLHNKFIQPFWVKK